MFKRRIPYYIVSLVLALLLSGLIQKENINKISPGLMQENAQSETFHSAAKLVCMRYNFTKNNHNFIFRRLQFDSTGFAVCKQMEPVLYEVENSVVKKIKVVFMLAMNPENQKLFFNNKKLRK